MIPNDTCASNENEEPVLEFGGLEHVLGTSPGNQFCVTVDQTIRLYPRDFCAILGPSGCGKTTLLSILGLLRRPSNVSDMKVFRLRPDDGDSELSLVDLREMWIRNNSRGIDSLRRRSIGFALQSGELLTSLTVGENITLPLRLVGTSSSTANARVKELMERFQLRSQGGGDLTHSRVNSLSGGEYQRVALARAIAHSPRLVFVDEPTAALNREMARGALKEFESLQHNSANPGATVMITHDESFAREFANVIITMSPVKGEAAGRVVSIERQPVLITSIEKA
jgi:putative ABC transport system ATP-binding protein